MAGHHIAACAHLTVGPLFITRAMSGSRILPRKRNIRQLWTQAKHNGRSIISPDDWCVIDQVPLSWVWVCDNQAQVQWRSQYNLVEADAMLVACYQLCPCDHMQELKGHIRLAVGTRAMAVHKRSCS